MLAGPTQPIRSDLLKADRLKAGGIKPGTWALNGRRSGELVRALPASFDSGRGRELGLKCSTTCDASKIARAARVLPLAFHYDLAADDGNVAFERATVLASRAMVVDEISALTALRFLAPMAKAACLFSAHVPGLIPPAFSRSAFSWSDLIGSVEQVSTWA